MNKVKEFLSFNLKGLLNSYSQIFFSSNIVFACILIIVTFFDFWAGVGGLFCVLVSNSLAWGIGLNKYTIKSGAYGFNSLLVGLGLAVYFQPSIELYVLLFFASLLTLFITVVLSGVIGKYNLPYLSTSFLIAFWLVTLSSREFKSLIISERGIYALNEMYAWGGISLINAYNWVNGLNLHESITIYLKSLGGIFFQYHIFAGILIAVGILIYSRIAFLLSIVGFFSAYFYYLYIGANIDELSYSFIGFNFILTAIAIGGYFIIPSKRSFLWVILLTPLISFCITSFSKFFDIVQLSIYSLPFNVIVIMFLYVLKFRERGLTKPETVYLQQNSPEKNLYSQINNLERFKNIKYFQLNLPFSGDWVVTQGHSGEYTHKDEWRHAWDFEIENDNRKLFNNSGYVVEDYYCYGKPILAPGDGIVEEIVDGVDDNEIGNFDIAHNWGNTIIINHGYALYSKISHIKKGSFKVYKGAVVKKGDIIAACGSSGRSPQPHAHFQLQTTPYIGSKTLDYPISNYILHHDNGKLEYKTFSKPNKGDKISNIKKDNSLYKALHFVPGQELFYKVTNEKTGKVSEESWEIQVDMYNNTYILNKNNNAKAYFKSENNVFYFTHYEGKKKGLLFYFYLGSYKLITGFYKDLELTDNYPLNILNKNILILIQDFFAPFYIFLRSNYKVKYLKKSEYFNESTIKLASETSVNFFKFELRKIYFDFTIEKNRINQITINQAGKKLSAQWDDSKLF